MGDKLIKNIDNNLWNRFKAVCHFNNRTIVQELTIIIIEHIKVESKKIIENENKKLHKKFTFDL